ncbi:MAG: type I restriction enzyme, S subunit [Phormidesmis priestleyi Ana]|uniref:Type I restriction enzyme, S subunit n=1 Tax=Phormidesmis priestleyi Ana TaxID=1666911 RepID=A0A0P7YP51_9CYAN|nr:MAG: type I restriction enzyme, S subunit [Phormidesmis priestleyi Ana]
MSNKGISQNAMQNWSNVYLRNCVSTLKSGLSRRIVEQDIGIPVITSGNLKNGKFDTSRFKYWYVKDPQGAFTESYVLDDGDILLNFINSVEKIGKVCIFKEIGRPCIYTTNLFRIKPSELTTQEFLYFLLSSGGVEKEIKAITKPAINQASFTTGDFLGIQVKLPPIIIQNKIVKILEAIDRAIASTEALIEKYQHVKAGLMHDLFTRGIGADGKLRPPREQAPELYKESAIGWIPKEWEALRLRDILEESGGKLQTGPFGSQLHAYEYTLEGVPFVMPQNIINGKIDELGIARIPENRAQTLYQHRLKIGDIIIARRGELSRAAAISKIEEGWVCGSGCFLLRLGGNSLDARFFSLLYRHTFVQGQVAGLAVGSTMPSLNNEVMGKLIFPYMSKTEQTAIADRVELIGARINTLTLELIKSSKQKSGLMHDLLTGKVSVTPDSTAITYV